MKPRLVKMPRINLFGTGTGLRVAIAIACQMAFVLFGYDQGECQS
jgi:hypothetical protein